MFGRDLEMYQELQRRVDIAEHKAEQNVWYQARTWKLLFILVVLISALLSVSILFNLFTAFHLLTVN